MFEIQQHGLVVGLADEGGGHTPVLRAARTTDTVHWNTAGASDSGEGGGRPGMGVVDVGWTRVVGRCGLRRNDIMVDVADDNEFDRTKQTNQEIEHAG